MRTRSALATVALFVVCLHSQEAFADPGITHEPLAEAVDIGETFSVSAEIESADGLAAVELLVRAGDAIEWLTVPMVDSGDGVWTGSVDTALVVSPDVDYYLRATDQAAVPKTTTLPSGAPDEHFVVPVTAPPTEDSGCTSSQQSPTAWPFALALVLGLRSRRR